jgi:2-polyprenyl-3-methyl-5-hydroxy-6-metoxy-1,4-benzoquinol methylase
MRAVDRLLRRWRIARAARHVRAGDRLLDVGCYDRSLIDTVGDRIAGAVGIDAVAEPSESGSVRIVRGSFPDDLDAAPASFDCVTALAVLEHVEDPGAFAAACHRLLAPGGRVVLTVPHPFVDRIVDALIFLRLADGMDFDEHHGFDVTETRPLFEAAGFRTVATKAFQLGLNRLFVFEKVG